MFFLVECAKRSGTWYRAGVMVVLCVSSVWAVVDVVLDVSLSLAVAGVFLVVGLVWSGVYLPSIDEWY